MQNDGESKKRIIYPGSILTKVNLAVAVVGIVLMGISMWLLSSSMQYVEYDLISDRLCSDIRYLRDELGENEGNKWSVRDDGLYIGDTLIGDGTIENANEAPFIKCEDVTGTFYYVFMKTCNDDVLTYVEDGDYYQGHYLRVAGTTKGVHGEQLEGTYMDRRMADGLDESPDGTYTDISNVNGRMIYCHYEKLYNEAGEEIGVISNGRSVEELQSLIQKQKTRGFLMICGVILFLLVTLGGIVTAMLKAIKKIKNRLETIGNGEFPEEPLVVQTHDELSDVANSVNNMVKALKEKERIGAELSLASDIQMHMLPSIFPPFPDRDDFDLYASMEPAKEVGGDFYDFFMLDDNHVVIVIADVSGKGVPAALFMVITKILLKNYVQMGLSPADTFTTVNQMLCEGNESGMFVTAWMGVLDCESGKLTYVNAGHNPPAICQNGEFAYLRGRAGFVLAGLEGIRYREEEILLQPGDRIFLYTDGVTEASDKEKHLYGEERLLKYINAHRKENAKNVLNGIRADIDTFICGEEQFDDMTMLMLDYQKRSSKDSTMIEREFEAAEEKLNEVNTFLEEQLELLQCPMKATMQILVAAEEIFVNIAHYAYGEETGKVRIGVSPLDDSTVSISFSDHGLPFDPLAKADPDVTLSAEERSIGGLGIFMVKKTMDDVGYKYENGQNILTLVKKFK